MQNHRQVGGKLGAYIRANNPSAQQIQAFLGDLLAEDELMLPMKDVVARPGFTALAAMAGTGGGAVQRDALLQELSRSYLPSVVEEIGLLISGLLDLPARQATGESESIPEAAAGHQHSEEEKLQPTRLGKQQGKRQRKIWSPFTDSPNEKPLPDFELRDHDKRNAYLARRARAKPGYVAGFFFLFAVLAAPWYGISHRSWALGIFPLAGALAVGFGIDFVAIAVGAGDGLGIVSSIAGGFCGAYIAKRIAEGNRLKAREALLARRDAIA
jgi:hypothetical protein